MQAERIQSLIQDYVDRFDSRTIVCTSGNDLFEKTGWNFSYCNDHYNGTITLSIFRITAPNTFEYHPSNGKVWKYRKSNIDAGTALKLIDRNMNVIGFNAGALKYYVSRL